MYPFSGIAINIRVELLIRRLEKVGGVEKVKDTLLIINIKWG